MQIARLFFIAVNLLLLSIVSAAEQQTGYRKLTSDGFQGSMDGVSRYLGNVRFLAQDGELETDFRADELAVSATANGDYQRMLATGNPTRFKQTNSVTGATFEVIAQEIELLQDPQRLSAKGKARFLQQTASGESVEIEAESLQLEFAAQEVNSVAAQGAPLRYRHQPDPQTTGIDATARRLEYERGEQQLKLSGKVTVIQGNNRLKAEQIFYDGQSGSVSVPPLPDQQVEIIQQAKEQP